MTGGISLPGRRSIGTVAVRSAQSDFFAEAAEAPRPGVGCPPHFAPKARG